MNYLLLRFTYTLPREASLPPFKGSLVQGLLAGAIRNLVCLHSHHRYCQDNVMKNTVPTAICLRLTATYCR